MISYKWFYEPIYKMNYYFIVCPNQKDFLNVIGKHYGITDIPFVEGAYGKSVAITSNGKVILCTWVKSKNSIAEFVHELIHTLIGLFETIDHPLKANNDEPIAYLAEYLTKQFLNKKNWKIFTK